MSRKEATDPWQSGTGTEAANYRQLLCYYIDPNLRQSKRKIEKHENREEEYKEKQRSEI